VRYGAAALLVGHTVVLGAVLVALAAAIALAALAARLGADHVTVELVLTRGELAAAKRGGEQPDAPAEDEDDDRDDEKEKGGGDFHRLPDTRAVVRQTAGLTALFWMA
jgi:hypothetical protein